MRDQIAARVRYRNIHPLPDLRRFGLSRRDILFASSSVIIILPFLGYCFTFVSFISKFCTQVLLSRENSPISDHVVSSILIE